MTTWADEYLRVINDCEKRESQLSEWERDFVQSAKVWLEKDEPLSIKQIDKLHQIWEKVTATG